MIVNRHALGFLLVTVVLELFNVMILQNQMRVYLLVVGKQVIQVDIIALDQTQIVIIIKQLMIVNLHANGFLLVVAAVAAAAAAAVAVAVAVAVVLEGHFLVVI